jgi:hypothetical protein
VVEEITTKPLPDVNALNEAVPKNEWEPGLDGKPKPPWSHQYVVYLLDPASAGFYTFLNSTTGARIAHEQLREKVITMRALRGARVVPVVKLTHRPMKTFVGMKHRPEFEVIGWKQLGGDGGGGTLAAPPQPQLSGPSPAALHEGLATSKAATTEGFQRVAPKPQPPASAADATLSAMEEISEPTTAELLNDELPW